MVDPEDAIALRSKQRSWSSIETASLWGFYVGFVATFSAVIFSMLGHINPLTIVPTLGIWTLIGGIWAISSTRASKFDRLATHAEFMDQFNSISKKYQERLQHVGRSGRSQDSLHQ